MKYPIECNLVEIFALNRDIAVVDRVDGDNYDKLIDTIIGVMIERCEIVCEGVRKDRSVSCHE
jgi:hypothetical protein